MVNIEQRNHRGRLSRISAITGFEEPMRRQALRSIGLVLPTAFALAAPAEAGLKPAIDGVNPRPILEHIKVLASDAFEGRGPGTQGEGHKKGTERIIWVLPCEDDLSPPSLAGCARLS
jgi:hypothetical protein